MPIVLALDQGTTGSTALVISADGRVVARAYREFTQHFPQPGWVEHDAAEIWRVTLDVAREALAQVNEVPAAIGITNQRETVVAWDRTSGEPLCRALVWQDRRTANRCRELRAERGDEWVARRTGLVWDPYFSGTKIEWMLREVPDVRRAAAAGRAAFGTIDSWLTYRLTSGTAHVTDHTNASRTLLYDIAAHDWDPELLELFAVPRESLPAIHRSSEVVGMADPAHLGTELPIAGIAGDQQAALYGQGCWEPGQAKNTYGTGAFLLMVVGEEREPGREYGEKGKGKRETGSGKREAGSGMGESGSENGGRGVLTTVACDAAGAPIFALEGSIFIAGAAIQWLRDGLGIIERAADSAELAASVADNGGVYFVPAFVGLGAPHWEPEARGTIVGLTRGSGRAHVVRAALEAMAFGTRDVLEAMSAASGVPFTELKVDGGAAANDWLVQFQTDTLGVRVARPDVVETTALGAAGLAGLATGVWRDATAFLASRSYQWFEPEVRRDAEYREWLRAVETALGWARNPAERS